MKLTTLGPTATVDEVVAVIDRDGGVIIRDFIDSATLSGLLEDLQPKLASNLEDPTTGRGKTGRLGGIFKHTRYADTIVRNPLYREAAERILCKPITLWFGDDSFEAAPTIQIGVTQLIAIHPGEGAQPLHRDDIVWHWRHPEGGPQARVQIMVAISDFTAENGGTLVVPQSHLWGDDRGPSTDQAIPTEMAAGSALIFIGSTFHGGGTNTTDKPRLGLTMSLDLGYLRQEENQYLTIPVDEARALPEDIQRLLGYDGCPPGLGYVEINGTMTNAHVLLEG
ncbi:phytanoyl-CoA dioxygenase family protein [Nocardia sp. NPDC058499]|uniref:phytanoyl-CoA dioxygenase family protein n=1 Tax=Nocardia sp. NPDC058499 TaxID=3346530 RepID=UPI003657D308